MTYRQRYKKREKYLEAVRQRKAVVNGSRDYDFEQHLAIDLRGTYEGAAKIQTWQRECFDPNYLKRLEEEVEQLAALADWEETDERRWRHRNRMPPTQAELKELVAKRRTAHANVEDEPPPLPSNDTEDATITQPSEPLQRDEVTLFGSLRKVQQVKSYTKRKDKKENV
jgi:hypothetical protein